jgi:capsular exopolysaccharide synthesis family protein
MSVSSGLAAAVGLAVLLESLDGRLRLAVDIRRFLGLDVLGGFFQLPGQSSLRAVAQEVRLSPGSRASESCRRAMAAVLFRAHAKKARTILVTSPARGDGRTTWTANLAIAVADTGRRVLLIDADCRNPTQHLIFGVGEGTGLSGLLLGNGRLADAIQPTDTPNLDLLPCGAMSAHTAALLHGKRFGGVLTAAAMEYDLVLLDSPATNVASDAQSMASLADGTLLVLRAHQSTRRHSRRAADALAASGARWIGVIVNQLAANDDGFHPTRPSLSMGVAAQAREGPSIAAGRMPGLRPAV